MPSAPRNRCPSNAAGDAADLPTEACGPGLHGLPLDAARLAGHASVEFSWRELGEERWRDGIFSVRLD